MTTFANQLKSEIARIAKKEARAETQQLKKASAQYRSDIATWGPIVKASGYCRRLTTRLQKHRTM